MIKAWKSIIDKTRSKLSMWKARTLSFSGRATLVKSVLGNLPTFYFSLFPAPIGIIDELEKKFKDSFYGGVARKRQQYIGLHDVGGAGLGSLRHLNLALLVKWWWKFKTEPHSLWAQIISGFHKHQNRPWYCFAKHNMGGVWSSIDKAKNGFWRLNIDVTEIMNTIDGGLTWRSDFVVDGNFNVARLRSRLDRASHPISDGDFWWLNSVPKKVASFIWRAKQGRIPSVVELAKRNIPITSPRCGLCANTEESAS
uniref:Reverse transcriptase zinc-binding domain-containing protein n=1 Tax=Lactuca sativa TaxID=4236 RepID=A0A9R1XTP8_LACSA|nr:hypothetical protein LSAT_V11C100033630 [Lactuca sativa]